MPPKVQIIGEFSFDMDNKDNIIGRGGYATVYKCSSKSQPSRALCIKIYDVDPTNYQLQKQLDQEQEVIKKLENASHQNLITIHYQDYFNDYKNYCIVMDLWGEDLLKYCTTRNILQNPFTENEILSFIKQIANGYKPFLPRDIIHRDIKPSNILINISPLNDVEQFYYKITDFDCSKVNYNNLLITKKKGTWLYCAPESDYMPQTQQADVFSFGSTLYYFVYGQNFKISKPDYQGGARKYSDYIENTFPKLERLSPKFETFIIDLLQRCLLKDNDKRITWFEIIQLKEIQSYEMNYNALDSLFLEKSLLAEKKQIKDRSQRLKKYFKLLRYKINILDQTRNLIIRLDPCPITDIFIISLTNLIILYYNFQLGLISDNQNLIPKFLINNNKLNFPKEDIILYTTELMKKKNILQGKEALEVRISQLKKLIKQFSENNQTDINNLTQKLQQIEDIIYRIQLNEQLKKCLDDHSVFQNLKNYYNRYFTTVLGNKLVKNNNDRLETCIIIKNISQIIELETIYDQNKYKEIKIPFSGWKSAKQQILE